MSRISQDTEKTLEQFASMCATVSKSFTDERLRLVTDNEDGTQDIEDTSLVDRLNGHHAAMERQSKTLALVKGSMRKIRQEMTLVGVEAFGPEELELKEWVSDKLFPGLFERAIEAFNMDQQNFREVDEHGAQLEIEVKTVTKKSLQDMTASQKASLP